MAIHPPLRITRIEFDNFKAFSEYTINLDKTNIVVGPNNAGKSTIIGAFRTLDNALRSIRNKAPTRVDVKEGSLIGFRIPENSLPIALENVQNNFSNRDSEIIFTLNNKNKIRLIFPSDGGCILLPVTDKYAKISAAFFKNNFFVSLTVVPVLGPMEHNEKRREKSTVIDGLSTHRASRHFRNYWHYFGDGFENFANLVKQTWPGMEIERPEFDVATGELKMFCRENRLSRELYWTGFGFQIWCQLLTHISRSANSSLIVVDEPETYLHPDVQRQIISVIRDQKTDLLVATHSSEIISDADPSDILFIDKQKRSGERLRNVAGVQRALDSVGSNQNITLTSLARSRRVLFVEGVDDFRILRRFARRLGLQELAAGSGIVPLPSGGFGSWNRVTTLAAGIAEALGAPLTIGAIYDRDYQSAEYIETVTNKLLENLSLAWVHKRKEIENYLLVPAALDRAIERALAERSERNGKIEAKEVNTNQLLIDIMEPMRDTILSQLVARRTEHLKSTGRDAADVTRETIALFNLKWCNIDGRLEIAPGKDILSSLRTKLQEAYGISMTDNRIIDSIHKDEIPEDIRNLLDKVEIFRNTQP